MCMQLLKKWPFSRFLQFDMPFLLIKSVVNCPHGSSTLVQLYSNKALVKREIMSYGILEGGGEIRGISIIPSITSQCHTH